MTRDRLLWALLAVAGYATLATICLAAVSAILTASDTILRPAGDRFHLAPNQVAVGWAYLFAAGVVWDAATAALMGTGWFFGAQRVPGMPVPRTELGAKVAAMGGSTRPVAVIAVRAGIILIGAAGATRAGWGILQSLSARSVLESSLVIIAALCLVVRYLSLFSRAERAVFAGREPHRMDDHRIDAFIAHWVRLVSSQRFATQPADRPAAERAIADLYASAGLTAPRCVWVRSPEDARSLLIGPADVKATGRRAWMRGDAYSVPPLMFAPGSVGDARSADEGADRTAGGRGLLRGARSRRSRSTQRAAERAAATRAAWVALRLERATTLVRAALGSSVAPGPPRFVFPDGAGRAPWSGGN